MLTQHDKHFYSENGYLLLKQFFDKKLVDQILVEAKTVFLNQFINKKYTTKTDVSALSESEFNTMMYRLFSEDLPTLSNCGKQVQHLISLHQLSLHSKILELLKSAGLKFPNISTRPVMYFNHPKLSKEKVFHTVDAHQDWRSMQGSLNSVVIWLPLMNINKALGALEILPKSHKMGLFTDHIHYGFGMVKLSDEQQKELLSVEVETGDALLFSSFLVHQSGNNITDSPRWSCHFRYNDLNEETFINRGYPHAYIYKPQEELITKEFPKAEQLKKLFSNE